MSLFCFSGYSDYLFELPALSKLKSKSSSLPSSCLLFTTLKSKSSMSFFLLLLEANCSKLSPISKSASPALSGFLALSYFLRAFSSFSAVFFDSSIAFYNSASCLDNSMAFWISAYSSYSAFYFLALELSLDWPLFELPEPPAKSSYLKCYFWFSKEQCFSVSHENNYGITYSKLGHARTTGYWSSNRSCLRARLLTDCSSQCGMGS